AVLADRGRPHGHRHRQSLEGVTECSRRAVVPGRDEVDVRPREGDPRGDRQARPQRVAQTQSLRAEERFLVRLDQGDDVGHSSTVTVPAVPSTRTRVPSGMRSVASRVPTTPGMPYSRATIAECESRPPLSVTIAPSSGNKMLNASVVASVNKTSPCWIRPNSVGPAT